MKKHNSRIFLLIAITLVVCASFQPIIAGKKIDFNQQNLIPIDDNSALTVAYAKLKHLKKTTYTIKTVNEILDDKARILCYVFNLEPHGYIVVSAYETLPPVLTYSFTSSFSEAGTLLLDLVKADLMLRLKHSSKITEKIIEENKALWNSYLSFDEVRRLKLLHNDNFSLKLENLNISFRPICS